MNAIQFLAGQPWVERLGATLLHFLWQGILIAGIYASARRWVAHTSGPNARYLLACAALAAMSAAPVLTWVLLAPPSADAVIASFKAPVSVGSPAIQNVTAFSPAGLADSMPAPLLPFVVAVWLVGAMVFCMRLLGGWILTERLRFRLVRPAPVEWEHTMERLKSRIGVLRPVRLLISAMVEAPAAVGWLRPVVLAPVGMFTGLASEQIEALLLHELAHIRRNDFLVNVLQNVVESLLFYHPAVWWISGHVRAERELCCDDVAVSVTGDAVSYARALAEFGSARPGLPNGAMAANGGSLAQRIARLLGQPRPDGDRYGRGFVTAAAVLALTAFAVFGQQEGRPKFEAASIKAAEDPGFRMVRPLPGRLTANAPVKMLLQNAYSVQAYQILGGPAWLDSERYAIEAKATGSADRAQIFLMLQALLEERFQLKIHRETREMPVFALVASRHGIKLSAPKEGSCVDPDPTAAPAWAGGRMPPPGTSPAIKPRCGTIGFGLQPAGAQMRGGKIAMPELVRSLAMAMGRPVIDRTGHTGLFDVQLDFTPDESTPLMPPPPPDGSGGSADSRGPSIMSALEEQLGLRLESSKGPVEVIVIDHVERPSAN